MSSLKSKIESLLLVTNYPLVLKKISEITGEKKTEEIKKALSELAYEYKEKKESGLCILYSGDKVQMVSHPDNSRLIAQFIKDETTGELTRASLETLTIIAYRGPISRAEMEKIRGVNCSIILRNLNMRGLVESFIDKKKMDTLYDITLDFMKYLGITDKKNLPDFEKLNSSESLERILQESNSPESTEVIDLRLHE